MVERPFRIRKAPGSNPGSSNSFFANLLRSEVSSVHFNDLTQSDGLFEPCLYSQAVEGETSKFTLEDGDCGMENYVFCVQVL